MYGLNAPKGVPVDVYMGNVVYSAQWLGANLSLSLGVNSNFTQLPTGDNLFVGPMVNVAKRFNGNINLSAGSVYNRQYTAGVLSSNVFNHKLSLSYKPSKGKTKTSSAKQPPTNTNQHPKGETIHLKPTLSVNAAYLQKLPVLDGISPVHELNVFVNAGINF